jgi:hypothetical protein
VREGEGSSVNQRQFSLPVGSVMSAGGAMTGGALVSNGRLASHEAIYLEDENQRINPLQQSPFLGKRGERSLTGGLIYRKEPIQMTQPIPRKGAGAEADFSRMFGINPRQKFGVGAGKKGGSVAIKSAIKQKVSEKIKALPMKKLTGQFSILNKVI